MSPELFRVVFVETLYESNVGAASRAMANMGFSELILVKPHCHLGEVAQKAAARGQEALQKHRVFPSWETYLTEGAVQKSAIRIAFSGKDGRKRPSWELRQALKQVKNKLSEKVDEASVSNFHIDLVFGREDWGLSHSEMKDCHFVAHLPTFGENPSLNISQAVLLALFLIQDYLGSQTTILEGQQSERRSLSTDYSSESQWEKDLKEWIQALGFSVLEPAEVTSFNAFSVLRRMLLTNLPTRKEEQVFQSVIQQTLRKLREWKILQNWALKQPQRPDGVKWPQKSKTDSIPI
jgi:tRNA/rRNA methyltransferase